MLRKQINDVRFFPLVAREKKWIRMALWRIKVLIADTAFHELYFGLFIIFSATGQAALDPLQYRNQTIDIQRRRYEVKVPTGYQLELLNDALDKPCLMVFSSAGELLIGSKSGAVYRLVPPYTHADVLVKLSGYPHSIALRENEILVARTGGIYRAPYQAGQKGIPGGTVSLVAPLPAGGGHNSRTVAMGPDERIYASLGISGNCSDQYLGKDYTFDDFRGGILVLKEAGTQARWEVFASGLRNPVGFAWHPATGVLYASNNGPDHHGFDQPPEYFARVTQGSFHGMPWFQYDGKRVLPDGCIKSKPPRPLDQVSSPVATFPARNAPMAVSFVAPGAMDHRFEYDAIVALHGS